MERESERNGGIVLFSEVITDRADAQASLRANEEKYRSLIESSDSVIALFDADGQILYGNTIAAQSFGLTTEAMNGKAKHELFPPPVADRQLKSIREVIARGNGVVHEAPSVLAGERRWYRTSIQPVRDATGKIYAGLINATDITRFKAAEWELRQSEAQCQQFMRYLPGAVSIMDTQGRTVYCNALFAAFSNSTPDKLIGRYRREYLSAESLHSLDEEDKRVLTEDRAIEIDRVLSRDGVDTYWLTIKFPIKRDNEATLIGTFSLDVTKEKLADAALKVTHDQLEQRVVERTIELERAKDRIEAIFNHSGDGILLVDIKHGIQQTNYAFDHMFGLSADSAIGAQLSTFFLSNDPSEVVGTTDFDRFPADMAAKFHADEDRLFQTGQPIVNAQERSMSTDHREIWVLTTKVPLRNLQGKLIGLVGLTHDISEIITSQEVLRRSEQQLRESQKMLQLVLDTIPVHVFWKNQDSVYMGCNRLMVQAAGLHSALDIVGKRDVDLPWLAAEADVYRADDLAVMQSRISKLDYEETQRTASGKQIIVRTSKLPLLDADDNVIGILGCYIDITEQKQAELALRQSEQRLRESQNMLQRVLDTIPVRVFWKDRESAYMGYNQLFAQDAGLDSTADIINRRDFELPWPAKDSQK